MKNALIVFLGLLIFSSCGKKDENVVVSGISLAPTTLSIVKGETKTVKADITPANASNKNVGWSSDKEDIATVNNGVITAKAKCIITAKSFSHPDKTASCNVEVVDTEIPLASISVDPSASVVVNKTCRLTATFLPAEATNKEVTWTTSDATVAEVSGAGLVTGKAAGKTADITVTSKSKQDKKATCKVTVTTTEVAVTNISFDVSSATILVGTTQQLTATILPDNATNKAVTWTSSDATVAEVSNTSLVPAKKKGRPLSP